MSLFVRGLYYGNWQERKNNFHTFANMHGSPSLPKFATVIFPLALPKLYTYAIPEELAASMEVGIRVEVSLKNKLYSALVARLHDSMDLEYVPKPIISLLDQIPVVTPHQMACWIWMAEYYCCTVGEVMHVAMPSGLKLESETKVVYNGHLDEHTHTLTDDEYLVAEAVAIQNELTILQIQDILQKKTIFPILRTLIDKRVISIKEELIEKFKPRTALYMTLNEPFASDRQQLASAFDLVAKSEKQTNALLAFVQLSANRTHSLPAADICRMAGADTSVLHAIAKKGICTLEKKIVSRIGNTVPAHTTSDPEHAADSSGGAQGLDPLSPFQQQALKEIRPHFEALKPVLLHGVTGSGKTRIYAECIREMMAEDRQTLYLLPEIALTNHMVARLKFYFGDDVLVYHSRMNNQERVEIWHAVMKGAKLVVAARSGVFLPFVRLGLIIVDEEHDSSFKQADPPPRYNARDTALYLATQHKAKILLGSATPSLESYSHALAGKFGLVHLAERHGEAVLPRVEIVDLKHSFKDKRFDGLFSQHLIESIEEALQQKEQVLLFQNRRGYAPTIQCGMCGWQAECANCDVKLTLHKSFRELRCHYCGGRNKVPKECPACGNTELSERGFGTEKIEEAIASHFPAAKVARLDIDTARTKVAFDTLMQDFEDRQIDILVGTQMITKGLDFDHISLVGVLNADTLFRYPDFRATERAFQLLTQVAGRAGRRKKQGRVIIQTFSPDHPVITETTHHLYLSFYQREAAERKLFIYPPFFRMIQLELWHKNAEVCAHAARELAARLTAKIGNRLIGPSVPSIARIRGQYIQQITIKMEKDAKTVRKIKELILAERDFLKTIPATKNVRIQIDVDPYHT